MTAVCTEVSRGRLYTPGYQHFSLSILVTCYAGCETVSSANPEDGILKSWIFTIIGPADGGVSRSKNQLLTRGGYSVQN
jgi:hypothetical protein